MASTYVNDLRLNEMATGDGSGTWGTTTNTNLELIAEKFGAASEALSDASTGTITMADGTSDAFRSLALTLTGSLSQACTVTLAPNTLSNVWIVKNSAGDAVTLTQGTGANVTIPNGYTKVVYTDGGGSGAAVVDAFDDLSIGPNFRIGNAAAEDTSLVFDGNAKDFYVGLDDSADKLVIGEGSTVGTNNILTLTDDTVTVGDGAAADTAIVFDGNAKDFYFGLDDSADKLVIGEGSTVGTNNILTITDDTVTIGDGAAADTAIVFDGNAQDFYIGLDDSADDLIIGLGSTVGTTPIISVDASGHVTMPLQSAFSFQTSAAITDVATDGAANTVKFGAQIYDQNGDFDASTFTFTAPVTGKYQLNSIVFMSNADAESTYLRMVIKTSNREYTNIIDPEWSADRERQTMTISVLADMDASDTAYVTIGQYEGTAQMDIPATAESNFSGYLAC